MFISNIKKQIMNKSKNKKHFVILLITAAVVTVMGVYLLVEFAGGKTANSNFEMYLVKDIEDKSIATQNVNKLVLEKDPFLTYRDIISYNWQEHSLLIKNNSKLNNDLLRRSFVVVANGERIYCGTFWSGFYSMWPPEIPIYVDSLYETDVSEFSLNIGRLGTVQSLPDEILKVISDKRIYQALKDLGILYDSASKNLTPDEIKKLYEKNTPYDENKPYYMEYICNKLGIEEWRGRPPEKLDITKQKLSKTGNSYTVVALSNPFDIRLHIFKGGSGHPWSFIDYIDFGGRVAGIEYHLEASDDHVWVVGNSCRGYGTGVARYYQDWYEVTDEGKKLVLSFPYDEYSLHYHLGGHTIIADTINVENSGGMKVLADYTITKKYPLYYLDIADEDGMVNVSEKRNVIYIWDEAMRSFVSEYATDEDGVTVLTPESPGITRHCDEILEKHYEQLKMGLELIETESNEFTRDARIDELRKFLEDCSEGAKKTALLRMTELLK